MLDLIQEAGRGKRGNKPLTYEEASRAADSILDGHATPAQTAAFLTAQSIKPESAPQQAAFIDALRRRAFKHPIGGSIDFAGTSYGRSRAFLAALPSAFVLNACRLPVTLHGGASLQGVQGKPRSTLTDIFGIWGIDVDSIPREAWIAGAQESGLLFVQAEQWCPPLSTLRALRQEIGIRTVFDTAERLLRPADSVCMAYGVASAGGFDKAAELLQSVGVQRALLAVAADGADDVPTDRRTRIYMMHDGVMDLHVIDPHTFGLHGPLPESTWTAELQAHTVLDVLQGRAAGQLRNAVILNSALRLWVAERTVSIEEGIDYAKYALDQGIAWKYYLKWRDGIGAPL
ncbi:anthranilate phosphoribosyltransferase [Paenibacillus sp. HJGM_3]|uniref:anthranilate phosphoribosyltransferase n=1 Tax=Paenibacillus sp. HJGM_3 TaxID=3379816 RepID=UPI00385CF105